ncbi:MAG: hypothetical protein R6V58_01955 [Planctomycetota bacterium]
MSDTQTDWEASVSTADASRRLARILVDSEVLSHEDVSALQGEYPNEYLGDVLVREGVLLQSYLQGLLIRALHIPYVPADSCQVDPEIRALLPESFCKKRRLMPVSRARDFLTVVSANPLDAEALKEVGRVTGLKIRPMLCASDELDALIEAAYHGSESEEGLAPPGGGPPPSEDADAVDDAAKEAAAELEADTAEQRTDGTGAEQTDAPGPGADDGDETVARR